MFITFLVFLFTFFTIIFPLIPICIYLYMVLRPQLKKVVCFQSACQSRLSCYLFFLLQRHSGDDHAVRVVVAAAAQTVAQAVVSQEAKGQPLGKPAVRLRYRAGVKVRVVGFRAYCQGRFNPDAGNSFVVWEEGVLRTTNNV